MALEDNLARNFPSRGAVVIKSSRGGAAAPFSFSFADNLAGSSESISLGWADQVTASWPQKPWTGATAA
jgi:hypothetical protein